MRQITDTGIRGYLKWLQQDQPQLYVKAAPLIAQSVPGAFSDREQSLGMGYLMQGFADDSSAIGVTTYFGDGSSSSSASAATPDVASAANAGASSPDITSQIGSIISNLASAFTTVKLGQDQLNTLNQVNQIQLQRAQAGLPPLNTSSLQLGVPTVNFGLSSSTLQTGGGVLLAVAGIIGAAILLGGKKRRAA